MEGAKVDVLARLGKWGNGPGFRHGNPKSPLYPSQPRTDNYNPWQHSGNVNAWHIAHAIAFGPRHANKCQA